MNLKKHFLFILLPIFLISCRNDFYEINETPPISSSETKNKSNAILSNAGFNKTLYIPNHKEEAYINSNFHFSLKDSSTNNTLYIFYIHSENSTKNFYNLHIIADENGNTIYKNIVEYNNHQNYQLYSIKENNIIQKSNISTYCSIDNGRNLVDDFPHFTSPVPDLGSYFPPSPPYTGEGGDGSCGDYQLSHSVLKNGEKVGEIYIDRCGNSMYITINSFNSNITHPSNNLNIFCGKNTPLPIITPSNGYDVFLFEFPKSERDFLYDFPSLANSFYTAYNKYGALSHETYKQIINAVRNIKMTSSLASVAVEIISKNKMSWEDFNDLFLTPTLIPAQMRELEKALRHPSIVKPTYNFITHEKLYRIYNQAKGTNTFQKYLQKFIPKAPVAHLMFDLGKTEKNNDLAQTSSPNNYWIKITFNKDIDWNNRPEIIVSYTFIHEILHAEMYRQLLAVANTNGSINTEKLKEYAKKNKKELFNEYIKRTPNYQHQIMAKRYIDTVIDFMKELYGKEYTEKEYLTIAWMGVYETDAWNKLPNTQKEEYKNIWKENYHKWKK